MHQKNVQKESERQILAKMNHIVDTFINNQILPKIRVDISKELANEIIYQKDYLSPYLFLEAYVSILALSVQFLNLTLIFMVFFYDKAHRFQHSHAVLDRVQPDARQQGHGPV